MRLAEGDRVVAISAFRAGLADDLGSDDNGGPEAGPGVGGPAGAPRGTPGLVP
jgi:hypothetical protein